MYLKVAALLMVVGVLGWLTLAFKPTRLGFVWGMLLLYSPFSERQTLAVAPLVNAMTVIAAVLVLFTIQQSQQRPPAVKRMRWLLCAWIAISSVGFLETVAGGRDVMELLPMFKRWLDPIIFAWLAMAVVRPEDRQFALACLPIGYAAVAVHAVREGLDYGASKRIPGLLGQANYTAAFLAVYAPLLLALTLFWAPRRYQPLLIGLLALGAAGLVPLESRGAMLGFAIGLMVVLIGSKRVGSAAVALGLSTVLYAAPDVLPERVTSRFESSISAEAAERDALEDVLEPSAANRIRQWKAAAAAIEANPTGLGFDRFKQVIGDYDGISGLDAHNFFVLVAVECGAIAPLILLLLFTRIFAAARAAFRHVALPDKALGVGLIGMLTSIVVVNMFGSRLMDSGPSLAFWSLAGMAVSLRGAPTLTAAASDAVTPIEPMPWRR